MPKIPSSNGVDFYDVNLEGKATCTCPHFVFHLKKRGACKHIEQARALQRLSLEEVFLLIDWTEPMPLYKTEKRR